MNLGNSGKQILPLQTEMAKKRACSVCKCNSFECYSPQKRI